MGQLWWIHLRYQYRLTGNVYGSLLCSLKKELQKPKGKRIQDVELERSRGAVGRFVTRH